MQTKVDAAEKEKEIFLEKLKEREEEIIKLVSLFAVHFPESSGTSRENEGVDKEHHFVTITYL